MQALVKGGKYPFFFKEVLIEVFSVFWAIFKPHQAASAKLIEC